MEQGMQLFARLVRMLLGQSAIGDRKLDCGLKVTILGIDVLFFVVSSPISYAVSLLCSGLLSKLWCQIHTQQGESE